MRVSLVTGGGRGIGRAIARALAGPETLVAVAARTRSQVVSPAAAAITGQTYNICGGQTMH